MTNLVNVKIHGVLANQMGRSDWKLNVKSVGEAIRAIECNSHKLYKQLMENDKKDIKYRVIINNEDFVIEEGKNPDLLEDICESELVFEKDNLKSIDIIPVIEGSDNMMSIITIVVGIALIWTGVGAAMLAGGLSSMTAMQGAMIIGGIGLVAAGVTNLMTPMPKFGDFREIEGGGAAQSYTFAGAQNTTREGGPVFVGYGRLLIGSHVIQSALDTVDANAEVQPQDTWGETKYGLFYNIPNAGGLLKTQTETWNN
jgi:predicted phage tail protein